jgi:hypothetical protein
VAFTLSNDLLMLIVGTAAGAILIHRRAGFAVVPFVVGIALFHAIPAYGVQIYGVSTTVGFAICAWAVLRGEQK